MSEQEKCQSCDQCDRRTTRVLAKCEALSGCLRFRLDHLNSLENTVHRLEQTVNLLKEDIQNLKVAFCGYEHVEFSDGHIVKQTFEPIARPNFAKNVSAADDEHGKNEKDTSRQSSPTDESGQPKVNLEVEKSPEQAIELEEHQNRSANEQIDLDDNDDTDAALVDIQKLFEPETEIQSSNCDETIQPEPGNDAHRAKCAKDPSGSNNQQEEPSTSGQAGSWMSQDEKNRLSLVNASTTMRKKSVTFHPVILRQTTAEKPQKLFVSNNCKNYGAPSSDYLDIVIDTGELRRKYQTRVRRDATAADLIEAVRAKFDWPSDKKINLVYMRHFVLHEHSGSLWSIGMRHIPNHVFVAPEPIRTGDQVLFAYSGKGKNVNSPYHVFRPASFQE